LPSISRISGRPITDVSRVSARPKSDISRMSGLTIPASAPLSQLYQFEAQATQESAFSSWVPSNGWTNGTSAVSGTYWGRTSNKTVKGWNLGTDGTPSGGTGPAGGVNTSTGGHATSSANDNYIYTEASSNRHLYAFVARTPAFNPINMQNSSNNLDLKFWVHGYGSQIGDLYVYIDTSTTSNHTNATELAAYESFSGYSSNNSVWQEKTISLNSYRTGNQQYFIYFLSQNATGFAADIAVDAVHIIES